MPIAVRVVNDQEFAAWVEAAKKKFATDAGELVRLGGRSGAVSRKAQALSKGQGRRDRKVRKDCKAGFENGNSDSDSCRSRP